MDIVRKHYTWFACDLWPMHALVKQFWLTPVHLMLAFVGRFAFLCAENTFMKRVKVHKAGRWAKIEKEKIEKINWKRKKSRRPKENKERFVINDEKNDKNSGCQKMTETVWKGRLAWKKLTFYFIFFFSWLWRKTEWIIIRFKRLNWDICLVELIINQFWLFIYLFFLFSRDTTALPTSYINESLIDFV